LTDAWRYRISEWYRGRLLPRSAYGANKMIYKITVFKAVQPVTEDDFPNLIFWVEDVRPIYGDVDVMHVSNTTDVAGAFEKPKVLN
jgi:hypothetical protein